MIGLAQASGQLSFNTIMLALDPVHEDADPEQKRAGRELQKLNLTDQEFAHLRLLCVFNPDNILQDNVKNQHLAKIQDMVLTSFREYYRAKHSRLMAAGSEENIREDDEEDEDSYYETSSRHQQKRRQRQNSEQRLVTILMKLPTLRALNSKRDSRICSSAT
ncbi:hypothetical protein quinque_016509, partial [Culex quinquefasciatus]